MIQGNGCTHYIYAREDDYISYVVIFYILFDVGELSRTECAISEFFLITASWSSRYQTFPCRQKKMKLSKNE